MKPTHCQHPDGCLRPVKGHGWCRAHLDRWRKTGDAGEASIRPIQSADRACSVPDCESVVGLTGGYGFCCKHYQRFRKHGDPFMVDKGGWSGALSANPNWSGDHASYSAAHSRLRRHRGRAADHGCVDCGSVAAHWSYDNSDPDERTDPRLGRYSTDLNHYEPRCVPCHKAFDNAARKATHEA